jgi:hypothetical protein
MTFTKFLADRKWRFFEAGLQVEWNKLNKFAAATTVGTFSAGAAMIGNVELDAASNPGLTAAVGILLPNSGQQNLAAGTAGQLLPSNTAVSRTPPTDFRS